MTRDFVERLLAEGLAATTWSNGPGDRYAAHAHGYDKVLVVASGSIEFELPQRQVSYRMYAGDRLDLPAGNEHAAVVGDRGVTCLEAQLQHGSLPPEPVLHTRWGAAARSDKTGGAA